MILATSQALFWIEFLMLHVEKSHLKMGWDYHYLTALGILFAQKYILRLPGLKPAINFSLL